MRQAAYQGLVLDTRMPAEWVQPAVQEGRGINHPVDWVGLGLTLIQAFRHSWSARDKYGGPAVDIASLLPPLFDSWRRPGSQQIAN
jgi:hypothetical protein